MKISIEELNTNGKEILLFGNIPYYISTQIFFKFLELELFKEAYFTVQKEFFETVNASFNTKHYSSLSVLFQTFCETKRLFDIGRLNFFPKPNVDSTFLSLKKKYQPNEQLLKDYSVFVKNCFARPRKILLNSPLFEKFSDSIKKSLIEKNLITKNTRISELSPNQILELFKTLKELSIL
ncbi:rRNA methyltransferase [Mycoplasma ovis str. Michigan]|uniref:rRNA methyltransferase n=1 Tax=Mycoplasma ovis str. Michigan TaxID=1415773 RepID=A0ABN4BQI2_9MOLU|nr:rRNA methyltransferase [Mycoplasma ovis str. Michigan]